MNMKYRIIKWLVILLAVAGFLIEAKLAMAICNWMGTESGAC